MKLKQFIFALVAMLSFSFSSFAQTTVTTAADLKAALESDAGSEVVLGGDITLPAQITIPKKTEHILDLNGHDITGGIYVYGTLTINDSKGTGETGSITASTYVLNGAGGSKIILNGGRIYRGSSWSVYTTGVFTVNGGEVENTIRVAGSGSIQLNGGTVTSVQVTSGNLNITDDAVVNGNLNIEKGAKGVNIADGTINGDITIATEATDKVAVSGGTFKDADAIKDYLPGGSALLEKPDGTYEIVAGLLKIGDTYYPTLAAALAAAADGATIELINQEGSVIAMNGSLYGNKSVTITGTATVDWSKGWLFVGRGGEGNATLTFNNANLTSVSDNASTGIHVSGREKNTNNKYDGTLVIKNSAIELDYLINKGAMTLDNSTLTVKNGFAVGGRPASETESGEDATATMALTNKSKLVVNNHNGMGLGYEAIGVMNVEDGSSFEFTNDFAVTAKGTLNVSGATLKSAAKLANLGTINVTNATVEVAKLDNDAPMFLNGANTIKTDASGSSFAIRVNDGVVFNNSYIKGTANETVRLLGSATFNGGFECAYLQGSSAGQGGEVAIEDGTIVKVTYGVEFSNNYQLNGGTIELAGGNASSKFWGCVFQSGTYTINTDVLVNGNGQTLPIHFTNANATINSNISQSNPGGEVIYLKNSEVTVTKDASVASTTGLHVNTGSTLKSAGNISATIKKADDATVEISGGTYKQDVTDWCTEGFMTQQNADGSFGIAKAVAKVGDKKYATLEEAFKAATSGCTIEIVSDVTVDYNWDARNTGGKFTVPVTINGNGKTIKFTASVNDNNYQAPFRFEADATVKNLIVDMSEVTDNRFRAISSKGNLTVDNSKFIGKDETLNCRAIIFGEGAGTNVGNLAIAITNSEFINWKRGITDNENAQDVKTVTITGNTLTDAGVGVSAKEKVTFTGNTVKGAYVNIKSYTAGNKLAVTATGNTLEANTDETGKFNVIDAGGVVNAEGFNIVAKGGSIIGYTSTEGIYGEVWGNSRESFVINVVDAQGNVMGTTSLNNVGGIIDGDVYVTWNIKFNAAANTDEYWTVAWTTAPSIDNMPAKVQLWVDDVKVSEGNVVLNGPDNIWPIYAAVTDANGKILSCHTSVADAAAVTGVTNIALLRDTNEEIILPAGVKLNTNGFTAANVKTAVAVIGTQKFASLDAAIKAAKAGDTVTVFEGTYAVPSMKAGITIVGEGNVLFEGTLTGTLENLTMKNIHIKGGNAQRWAYAKGNLVFENVTFEATSVYALHFDGIAEGTNLTYKNCTIIGWAAMGGSPESCVFEGCTIKGNGSYGLIRTYFDTTIKDCTFDVSKVNTTDAYEDGIHAVGGAEVVVDGCTNANGDMEDLVNVAGTSIVVLNGVEIKNAALVGDNGYATFAEALVAVKAGETLTLLDNLTMSEILVLDKAITLNGNGKTLTSTAKRAINVSGANGVTIQNLTINASGERAINVIQNATNVTIEKVTATAANYTVNVASSAPNAEVAISNSTLNGLCTVNVSAAGAKVTVDNSTVNCNDNNTTAGEAYAALCLNKEAVGGSIIATNSTINVTAGSDSMKGRNGAENGTVIINGSTDDVDVMVAVITYEGSDYYHSFSSLAEAVEFAKAGDVVTLISDVTVAQPVVINKSVTLNGNGKTLTYTGADRAIEMPNVADANYDVTIKNLNVVATTANRGLNYNENGKFNVEGVTVTIGENVDGYAINFPGMADGAEVTIKDSKLTSRNPLNIWGENMVINVYDSEIISVDNNSTYDYAAIQLNADNYGNVANGTVVNVYGGTITALNDKGEPSNVVANASETGVVNISDETVITGKVLNYVANIGGVYYGSLQAAVNEATDGQTITLMRNIAAADIITINKPVTIDGKGKTLTSTAGRAINVDCAGSVAIKNLTINAKGERAINVIQKPANVTIEGVTATAANYTVNLASSAGAAEVAISNSNLTGLNVVNVAAPGSNVTISGGTITCNDQNANENYAALTLNKDAKNGKITAAGVEFNIEGNSRKATNQAENGTITIDGSANEVEQHVAYISYGNNWYGFATLEAAIAKANAGETVTLLRNVTVDQPVAINKAITLDGNSKTLTYTGASRAITVDNNADADIDVTIKNLTINNTASYTERGINYNENGTLTLENVTVNGEHTTYAINLPGMSQNAKVVITGSKFTGLIALNIWGANTQVTAENSEFYSVDHSAAEGYAAIKLNNNGEIAADNATVVINGGKVIAKDENGAASIAVDDCTNGSTVTISATTEVVGSTTKSVAIISYGSQFYSFSTIEEAIAMAKDNETIELISDVTISYGARDLLATAAANKAVTIDGKGHTLTLNQTNSDWASIGLENNNKLVLKNMTIEKTGYGDTSGAWNTHAIIFSCPVEMNNVTVNNSVAVQAGATLNNVTINEAGEYYGLWINGNGQTVTVNGGAINAAANGGRGIKIADQYIDAPAQVTLNVTGTKFTTAKKAAVLVSSKAGAQITASNVNIENVVADNVNFAWVDGDWATYFGNVTVNGAPAVMEDAASFVAAVTVNGAVKAYYATIAKAIEAVQDGEAVELVADVTATEVILLGKSVTINGKGHKVTSNATRVFRVTTSDTEVTLNDVNMVNTAVRVGTNDIRGISVDDVQNVKLTLNNCSVDFTDASANDWTYAVNVVGGSGHVVTVNGGAYEGANVINVRGANQTVTVKDATLTSLYPNNALYFGACIYVVQNENSSVVATGNTFNGDNAFAFNVGYTPVEESDNIDNTKYVVAMIGDAYYTSIQDAVEAAQNGETIKLTQNVKMDTKGAMANCGGYSSIFNVKGIELTFDLNGHTITVGADPVDFANAKGNMLMGVFTVDDGGKLTIDDSSDDKTGAVNVKANEATVYSLAAAYGKDAKLTINNGSYYVDEMPEATSLIYAQHSECVIINGGTYNIGNVGTGANASPWIFNTKGQNMDGIYVYGGTYPNDINHQFWFNEAIVPGNLAVKANENGTWSVVEAVAYTNEVGRSTGSWRRNVGYATIEEAIAATKMYNCEGNVVTLAKNVEIEQMITVANGVEVTLDLNGKTLAATDKTSKNYSAIDNRGDLTIVDSSEGETGKITVTATVNSGWNRYSAVIANNPGGELTVMSGTIEHLGGTDMAYGIDNLTNGKGTHAVTEIYGGTVKSAYIAVRQFLNGVEANNALAVYGGTLNGKYSIFFQDPNVNANSGTLYVDAKAALNASVYLGVTAGSTEWPVEVEVAVAALKGESTVVANNVPANYHVTEYPTAWIVECSELAELTINEADYAETGYINLVEKTVETLTYVREFTGAWETIYLPFNVKASDLAKAGLKAAYIYNASNKNNDIFIDYVEIEDEDFELMANYPYLICAAEAGVKEIVVESAILKKTTEQETIDCSTVFEKFTFIGNYAANFAPEASVYKKYYVMEGGEWTSLDVLNPFRFYFQIEYRNGSAFVDNAQAIRMRSVNANGEETTGINGVDAEQAGDFIFDLHGRRVLETEKGGIYIKGGKKFIAQ